MTDGDIWQIIIGIVSMIATLSLTLIIWLRQIKIEKEVRKQKLEEKSTNFIISNKKEIELLPLCIISNNISKTDTHSREIYINFNKLSKETQVEVLKKENILKIPHYSNEVIDSLIQKLKQFETKYEMGRSMLYDGAKYFFRAYERYKDEKIEDINPYVFDKPFTDTFFPDLKFSLTDYIDNYLCCKVNPNNLDNLKFEEKFYAKPMDLLYDKFDLGGCREEVVCFWIMRYIISTCYILKGRSLVDTPMNEKYVLIDERQLETYEDMFYYTIQVLYKTFSE